jgi:hypothetical protein
MLEGKGVFIWQAARCEGGDPAGVARIAAAARLVWIALKIADGNYPSNWGLLNPLVAHLRASEIKVWGWQYVYGDDWEGEAAAASAQIAAFELDGFIVDAEAEYKQPGREIVAARYLDQVRAAFPSLPIALCSYRFPTLHPEFPWDAFLSRVDLNMPQVYWEGAHDPAEQLVRTVAEFNARAIRQPLIPVAPAYRVGRWAPTAADALAFKDEVRRLNLAAWSFFSWDECRRDLPEYWQAIAGEEHRQYLPWVEKSGA